MTPPPPSKAKHIVPFFFRLKEKPQKRRCDFSTKIEEEERVTVPSPWNRNFFPSGLLLRHCLLVITGLRKLPLILHGWFVEVNHLHLFMTTLTPCALASTGFTACFFIRQPEMLSTPLTPSPLTKKKRGVGSSKKKQRGEQKKKVKSNLGDLEERMPRYIPFEPHFRLQEKIFAVIRRAVSITGEHTWWGRRKGNFVLSRRSAGTLFSKLMERIFFYETEREIGRAIRNVASGRDGLWLAPRTQTKVSRLGAIHLSSTHLGHRPI